MAASAQAGVSIPFFEPDEKRHRRNIAAWAQWVNQGHLANTGVVTLGTGTAATVVTDSRIGINSVVILQPSTSEGLSAAPTVYVSTVSAGGFTIVHSSTVTTGKSFRFALLG